MNHPDSHLGADEVRDPAPAGRAAGNLPQPDEVAARPATPPDGPRSLFPDAQELYDRALRETALACGVDGFTSRRCRATCATLIGDPSDAQAQLGHADAAMTMRHYRRAVPERLRARLAEVERETKQKPGRKAG